MDDTTILGGTLNQLGQAAKQTAKQIIKIPEEMASDLGKQVGGGKPGEQQLQGSGWKSNEERINFLRGLYGSANEPNDGKAKNNANQVQANQKSTEFQEQIADKSPEEQKKLTELRNQLHKENYYDPLVNPPKQEERPAEKVEREKQVEMQELQQKEAKKPQPIAVVREQNKAEMFRGAAG